MKLIIQIPCYNEAETLPETLAELPTHIEGIDTIEVLIINDGSTDETSTVATNNNVNHIIEHKQNLGLATAFQTGLTACLERGADIIVNTDADNQYPGRYIGDLVTPILNGNADIVIGDRQVSTIEHFSATKKLFQYMGSALVRYVSNTDIPDAPSGFRAISRNAALRINIFTKYTYTLEMIIQAGRQNFIITSIPIVTNAKTRESRLMRSIPEYIGRSAFTILRLFMLYKPLRSFIYLSIPFLVIGIVSWVRFLILMFLGFTERGSNIQSIILGGVFILLGFIIILFGVAGDLIAVNRRLNEETLYYIRQISLFQKTTEKDKSDQG
ncbi:MAG: glycosyltransferase family 2 protein [Phototrophicaceae bacterium]